MKHVLYKTGDADAPESIKDTNGDVVLDLCKLCKQAEVDLEPECEGPTQLWYFTFGSGQAHPNCYVKLMGSFQGTRKEMFRRYGAKWSMQYDAVKGEEVAKRWNMKEVE